MKEQPYEGVALQRNNPAEEQPYEGELREPFIDVRICGPTQHVGPLKESGIFPMNVLMRTNAQGRANTQLQVNARARMDAQFWVNAKVLA